MVPSLFNGKGGNIFPEVWILEEKLETVPTGGWALTLGPFLVGQF